jgi:hypothetical protein
MLALALKFILVMLHQGDLSPHAVKVSAFCGDFSSAGIAWIYVPLEATVRLMVCSGLSPDVKVLQLSVE